MTKDAPKRARGKGDARAILAAWEWAAEIRRRLERAARFGLGGAEWDRDEHDRQIASFDDLVRRGDPWRVIDAFCGADIETAPTCEAVEALRSSCLSLPGWQPWDHRRRTSRDIPPNAKAALGEAARMAIYLVRLHHKLPLTPYPVETLEEPSEAEREELRAEVWDLALERIPHAVVLCAPNASPPADWKARIVAELEGEEVRAALDWTKAEDAEGRGPRGGPEHAAFVLVGELSGAGVNTIRDAFLQTQPRDREKRKRDFQRDQEAWRTRDASPSTPEDRAERHRRAIEAAIEMFPPRRGGDDWAPGPKLRFK